MPRAQNDIAEMLLAAAAVAVAPRVVGGAGLVKFTFGERLDISVTSPAATAKAVVPKSPERPPVIEGPGPRPPSPEGIVVLAVASVQLSLQIRNL